MNSLVRDHLKFGNPLKEVAKAHHQAFVETDGEDPDWPIWYAGELLEDLRSSRATSTESTFETFQ